MELTFHRMEYKKQRSKYNKPDGGVTENTINSTTPTLQDECYSHFLDSRKPHFNEAK